MPKLYENIKRLRLERKMSQSELAKRTGYTDRTSIAKIERGSVDLPQSRIEKFAAVLGVSEAELMGYGDQQPKNIVYPKMIKVPLIGEIACGKPIYANEEYGEFGEIEESVNADFCLTAKGDSMTGARIHDGDLVFCRNTEMVDNGQIAAVIIEDSATLKRFYYYPEKDLVILRAENPDYEDQIYSGEELNQIHVIGQAVAFQSYVK